jgi:hypothetical protein
MSLYNLTGCLFELDRRQEALVAIAESVELYRSLFAGRPKRFTSELVRSLDTAADVLSRQGRYWEALAAAAEAAELRCRSA